MILSPNRIMGSLVYRTRLAMNRNKEFMTNLKRYSFHPNCLFGGEFHLWHFPGTHNEISQVLTSISGLNAAKVKFPAILNYQSIKQNKAGGSINEATIHYSLALVGLVDSNWTTEHREAEVFDLLLRPIYEEFIRQVRLSGYFSMGYNNFPDHDYYEIFTTGKAGNPVNEQYGDYLDAIRIMNLALPLRSTLCDKDFRQIDDENNKVTLEVTNILNPRQWQDRL